MSLIYGTVISVSGEPVQQVDQNALEGVVYTVVYHLLKVGTIVAGTALCPVNIFVDNVEPVASRILMTNVQLTFDRLLSLTMA